MEEHEMNVIVDKSDDLDNTEAKQNHFKNIKLRINKMPTRKKWLWAIAALVAVIGVGAGFWIFCGNWVNPADFIRIEYNGANGYAKAVCTVDADRFYAVTAGKNKDMQKRDACRQLADSLQGEITASDIKNGDRLIVKVDYDEEAARTAGVKIAKDEYRIKVSGISKGIEIDLFEKIEVVFAGISPEAYVVIQNRWTDSYLGSLAFEADQSGHIAVGDQVRITCSADTAELARHGYLVKTVSAAYTADRLSSYVSNVSKLDGAVLGKISQEAAQTIVSQTADTTFRMLYKATKDTAYLRAVNEEKAEDVQLLSRYFLNRKNASEGNVDNCIYLIYRADISNAETSQTVYFAFEYTQGYITVDGQFDIAHDQQEKRYVCMTDYDALYELVLAEKENLYHITEIK